MYKDNRQLRIEDYVFPYGELDPENDWVKLAALVPWDVAEERYAAQFVNNGHPAHPARMALGALLVQRGRPGGNSGGTGGICSQKGDRGKR